MQGSNNFASHKLTLAASYTLDNSGKILFLSKSGTLSAGDRGWFP